jgi:plastocyanin
VLVRVKSGLEGKTFAIPEEPVTLDQQGCMYKPHVLGMQAGQKMKIVSSDDTTHNIHPLPRENREWNVSQAAGAGPIMQSFSKPEVSIPVKCNQHSWMRAYVHVLSNPFYTVTGEDGSFEIKGLPPGKYEIEAVHEQYGGITQSVDVAANQTATTEFTYKTGQASTPTSLKIVPAMVLACCDVR